MEREHKLKQLLRIARAFEAAKIDWAAGGSLMLWFRGVCADFHDLDLTVSDADGPRAADILARMGAALPLPPAGKFRTKLFRRYEIEGVEVDLMAGLAVEDECGLRAFPLSADPGVERVGFRGARIPLQGLAYWAEIYRAMGRSARAAEIERWLAAKDRAASAEPPRSD